MRGLLKHLSSGGGHGYGVALFVVLLIVAIYVLLRRQKEKRELEQLMTSFRVTVATDLGPIELRYGHIELLSELVKPRSAERFRLDQEEWNPRLGDDVSDVLGQFVHAGLVRRSRSVSGGLVLTTKGAALISKHGLDGQARRAATHRVRRRKSIKAYPNEKGVA